MDRQDSADLAASKVLRRAHVSKVRLAHHRFLE
jgi:hypothetical protein